MGAPGLIVTPLAEMGDSMMRRAVCLIFLGCLCGCGGTSQNAAAPDTFAREDMGKSFAWMHAVYEPVREAEARGNELLAAEAAGKAAKRLRTAVGQEVEWTLLVDSVRRAAAGDPEVPEDGTAATGVGYVLVFDPPDFQKDENGGDTFHVYLSRTAEPQESHPYLIHLGEGDREYARTLTRGAEVTVAGKVAKLEALDDSGSGFSLVLVNARVVNK